MRAANVLGCTEAQINACDLLVFLRGDFAFCTGVAAFVALLISTRISHPVVRLLAATFVVVYLLAIVRAMVMVGD